MSDASGRKPGSTRRSPWPYAVVGVFVAQAGILAATMVLAARSPANAEPDYYERAMAWNEHNAARNLPAREGWTWEVHAGPGDGRGQRTLTIELADRDGRPLSGATVQAVYFHRARPLDRGEAALRETSPGVYAALTAMPGPGLWETRFDVKRHGAAAAIVAACEAE